MTATPGLHEYARAAKRAGLPLAQLANFAAGQYIPQRKQLPFHAAAREADTPTGPTMIAQGGARGGAKSHAAICQVALDDCARVDGLKWLYLRSVGKSARESFEDFIGKALPTLAQYYIPSRSKIVLPNGSQVVLGGFRNERDIDSYIGIEYDGILVDDAQLVPADRRRKLFASMRTSKPGWRPRGYLTFNPGGVGHAQLKAEFVIPAQRGQQTSTRFFFSLPEDNVFLNPEYVAYLDTLTGWLHRAWRRGDFDIAAGQFFTTFDRAAHVIPPFPIPDDWRVWCSLDYGFNHPTVVYLHAQDGDGNVYTVDEHRARGWQTQEHCEAITVLLARWGILHRARLWKFVAGTDVFAQRDPSAPTVAKQYEAGGYHLTPARTDRIAGAANILALLGDPARGIPAKWHIFNGCYNLIDRLPALEHDPHRPEDVLKVDIDEEGNGGDDEYDAARYGLMEVGTAAATLPAPTASKSKWTDGAPEGSRWRL